MSDSPLSIKDASGRQFSLLNDVSPPKQEIQKQQQQKSMSSTAANTKRKYHCNAPGCNKSFTTSGHLARHNRIHTGEKNFHCLHPGCPSRFSRQDNMMQHYRTHLSQKARRQQQQLVNRHHPHHRQQQQQQNHYYHQHQHHHHPYQVNDHMFPPFFHLLKQQQQQPNQKADHLPGMSFMTRYAGTKPYPLETYQPIRTAGRPRRTLSVSSSGSTSTSSGSFFNSPPPTFHSPPPAESITLPSLKQREEPRKSFSGLLHLANIVSTFG